MKLNLHKKAVKEITELKPEHQQYIWEKLQELKKEPNSHENTGTIQVQGRTVFKYVMKGEIGGKDYRAVYDIENSRIRIFAVFHRDQGYDKDKIARRF
ncbi:MAG: type II toxin-antitoxin system RelE/ParE family toxin [Candidatus Nanohalobium sp.]